jgi:CheY-like chemotaxis protein
VLVAEDDTALRELMAQHLAFEGYFVTEAADAPTMLAAILASQKICVDAFDLIVTDVRMPGMTGLDALTRIRESGCKTPAIVVSALPGESVQREVQALDAFFLPKPFALENLRKIANRVVLGNQSGNLAAL